MNKRSKLILLVIFLIVLSLFIIKIFDISSLNYKIKSNKQIFYISENYKNNYYYFEIKNNNYIYPINIYNINKGRKIINKIYSYIDKNYNCILPIFDDEIKTDMMCYTNNTLYNYQSIKGYNKKLDEYVKTIKEYPSYVSEDKVIKKIDNTINIYNNVDKLVSITTYKGIIVSGKDLKLFDEDNYNNTISTFINNYYIVADYNEKYEFNKFYVVNLLNKNISTIETKNDISFDSYIQGIVENNIYLYDKDNEIQYEINIENKEINIVSNSNYIKYYSNNKWEKMNKTKANKVIYFNYDSLENKFSDYSYVYENEYYYYLIDKENNLYRVNKNNIDVIHYLINVPVNDIKIKDNYIYYLHNDKIYYYNDITGLKLILSDTELKFNNTIKYYIY